MPNVELEQHRAFAGVIDVLEAIGADYVIWGGVAAVAYGEQRFTHDMDVVIRLSTDDARFMAKALEEDGYHVSLPSILDTLWGGFFNIIHLETNVKVDFFVPGPDSILHWAFQHRRRLPFDEIRRASFMPPESVILTKLRAYRGSGSTRHLDDIESILRVSGPELDLAYINREAARMGVFGTWRELLDRSGLA
jgi:hypothetical protein